jgi:hypothetical protein
MKQSIVLLLVTSIVFLAGCCTSHQATAWDYKIIRGTIGGHSSSLPPLEKQLDQAAADGWQAVTSSGGDTDSAIIKSFSSDASEFRDFAAQFCRCQRRDSAAMKLRLNSEDRTKTDREPSNHNDQTP